MLLKIKIIKKNESMRIYLILFLKKSKIETSRKGRAK
jgi:hypothetical protein